MDLETFFTTVYVLVDDWYKQAIAPHKPVQCGVKADMSDSEVLTLALAGQWRGSVPWDSERGVVRYVQTHAKHLFPKMLHRSAFNRRSRCLYGVLVRLQEALAEDLETPDDIYECVDCQPLPAFSCGQAQRSQQHWLWTSQRGYGGTQGSFYWGDKLLLSVSRSGAVTGWVIGAASINDRWLLEALLSLRAGSFQLLRPEPNRHAARRQRPTPPHEPIGPLSAAGKARSRPYLADRGFNGRQWVQHWQQHYQAQIISVPPTDTPEAWTWQEKRWLATHRQKIETAFSVLDQVLGLKHLNAHSRWGQYARLAAKMAVYNLGLLINRTLGRPQWALATLIT